MEVQVASDSTRPDYFKHMAWTVVIMVPAFAEEEEIELTYALSWSEDFRQERFMHAPQ